MKKGYNNKSNFKLTILAVIASNRRIDNDTWTRRVLGRQILGSGTCFTSKTEFNILLMLVQQTHILNTGSILDTSQPVHTGLVCKFVFPEIKWCKISSPSVSEISWFNSFCRNKKCYYYTKNCSKSNLA